MKVDSLGDSGGLNNINQKAKDIKKEAEDLLNKASKGIEQLRSEYMKLLSVPFTSTLLSMICCENKQKELDR